MNSVRVFSPATSANLGPGFDVMGLALKGIGDTIEARRIDEKKVRITEITGNDSIPKKASENTAGIAAMEVLKVVGAGGGVELRIRKGIPLASGLGGSAASAAAGGFAANMLYGEKLKKRDLILPCAMGEAKVSGFHCDNVAPSILGGITLVRPGNPPGVTELGSIDVTLIIAHPDFLMLTKQARQVLPKTVSMECFVRNMSMACSIVAAISKNDVRLLGSSMEDSIVEPVRGPLIPGYFDVKRAAMDSGACGCTISGSGPSVLAITDDKKSAERIGASMKKAFGKHNLQSTIHISGIDKEGTRAIS
jgi:homoserine kinase